MTPPTDSKSPRSQIFGGVFSMAFSMAYSMAFLALLGASAGSALAAQDYPGCGALVESEFKLVTLADNKTNAVNEPLKMAFDMDNQGVVDVYFVERSGKVRKYVGATKEVLNLGTVKANLEAENGLTGIALDPGFKVNKRLYLFYGIQSTEGFQFRVSRFTLNESNLLDMASEKVVLAITAAAGRIHTGGAMAFDSQGNLFITVGDNGEAERGPGNTNDLRGKILRIRPTAEGGYTIPSGNLFTEGTAKTRPEIYIMGTRNAYSLTLDPTRPGWVSWGDVGPDGKGTTEEHNTATMAANFGYPFYAGNQVQLIAGGTPEAPVNNHAQNTGLVNLPPAKKATNAYAQAAALTGPLFRYRKKTDIGLPPHFDGMWFVTDFNNNRIDTILLNSAGDTKVGMAQVFRNIKLSRALDFQQGPDGALYIINYSGWMTATETTALVRIEYSGNCRPEPVIATGRMPTPDNRSFTIRGQVMEILESGRHVLEITDLAGSRLARYEGEGAKSYDLSVAAKGRAGLYITRLTTSGLTQNSIAVLGSPQ